jgi:TRAP-type C4-dicarboxylate transport system permease large subunit
VPTPWGLVTGSGPLGLLLPPSLPLILYGSATYLVLDRAILSGTVPAVLLIGGVAIAGMLGAGGDRAERERFRWRAALRALAIARWELALAAALLASLASGLLHVHEAAALGALYVLAVELLVHRALSPRRDLPRIALSSIVWSGVVLLLFVSALGFVAWVRDSAPVTAAFASLEAHDASQLTFLLLAALTVGLATALLDVYGALLAVAPLAWPNADHYGVDPYQLAIVVLLAAELGRLRPPLRARLPFAAVLLAVLLLAIKLPLVSTIAVYRIGSIAD